MTKFSIFIFYIIPFIFITYTCISSLFNKDISNKYGIDSFEEVFIFLILSVIPIVNIYIFFHISGLADKIKPKHFR